MTLHAPNLPIDHIYSMDYERNIARCRFRDGNITYVYWVPIYDFTEDEK